ncbi:MAG: glycosyltransferase family 2 protein [Acidobacterium ailaaui]|nr:glycosyltransferase family 2 protein [Pseudacidobacterium ailaaui]
MNTNKFPLVSLITLNYNNTDLTYDFLSSIRNLTYKNIEVIVVDNHSEVDPGMILRQAYPDVKIVYNDRNLGFTGGNNAGIKVATGDYLFFINNDTVVSHNLIEPLLQVFDNFPDAGAVSPKFHYFFSPGVIEYAGYEKVNSITGRNKMIGCLERDTGQYDVVSETNYAHGGGIMIPKKVMDEIGGKWPDIYFIYYEEFDLCEQIKRLGYKIYYQPACVIHHKESMTTGKGSPFKVYYMNRNRILFMRRNVNKIKLFIFFSYFVFITFPKNTILFILRREKAQLIAFFRAIWWHIRHPLLS